MYKKQPYLIDSARIYKITSYSHCLRAVTNKVICVFRGYYNNTATRTAKTGMAASDKNVMYFL